MSEWKQIIYGQAFHAISPCDVECLPKQLYFIDQSGRIEDIIPTEDNQFAERLELARQEACFTELTDTQFLLPGFVDTHIHAPQWAQIGKALHEPLPVWLQTYTFPLESSYKETAFIDAVYGHLIDTLLANGTTTAQYFGTVQNEANKRLALLAAEKGQRPFVGKVVMDDRSQSPDFYRDDTAEEALKATEDLLDYTKELSRQYLQGGYGVVTPRFIPTCTDEVLYGLADLAKQYHAPIQSHCSEGDWEHGYVLERTGLRDTEALDKYGLLTDRTTLAHCVFLSDEDAAIFRERGTAIAHCPISNSLFADAVLPLRRRLEQQVKVSLATDISAGFTPSMFDNMRQAIISSRMLEDGVNPALPPEKRGVKDSRIDFRHAFYIATKGGADALHIQSGRFEKLYNFDAMIFDTAAPGSNMPQTEDTPEELLQKAVFLGTRANIVHLFVQGRQVF